MAVDRTPQKQEAEAFQKQADEIRHDLERGYAFVEGRRYTEAAEAFTIEEAMDRFIERMSGKPPLRPNELEKIAAMRARVITAVEKAKNITPETFAKARSDVNVNTR